MQQNFSNAFGDPAELQAYLAQKAAAAGRPTPMPLTPGGGVGMGGAGGAMMPPWANAGGMASYLDSGYQPPWMSEQLDAAPAPSPAGVMAPEISAKPDVVDTPPLDGAPPALYSNPGLVAKPGPGLMGKPAGGAMRPPMKPGGAMGARPPVRPMPGKPTGGVNSNPFAQAGGAPAAPTLPPQKPMMGGGGGQSGRIAALLARIRSSGQGGAGMAA